MNINYVIGQIQYNRKFLFYIFFLMPFFMMNAKCYDMLTSLDSEDTELVEKFQDTLASHYNVHYAIIPGQIGVGGEHLQEVGAIHPHSEKHITFVDTPLQYGPIPFITAADFGQDECQKLLHEKLDPLFEDKDIHKIVFHASSQGTASIVKYLHWVKETDEKRNHKWGAKIGALVLESAMLSGNSAIHHCVTQSFRLGDFPYGKYLGYIPFSYYWMPYLAKFKFPFYTPGGVQPLDILEDLPHSMPVIILHSELDEVLSHEAAQVVYAKLKKRNPHVYFISSRRNRHINLLKKSNSMTHQFLSQQSLNEVDQNLALLNKIWKYHQLPYCESHLQKSDKTISDLHLNVDDLIIEEYAQKDLVHKMVHRSLKIFTIPFMMFFLSANFKY